MVSPFCSRESFSRRLERTQKLRDLGHPHYWVSEGFHYLHSAACKVYQNKETWFGRELSSRCYNKDRDSLEKLPRGLIWWTAGWEDSLHINRPAWRAFVQQKPYLSKLSRCKETVAVKNKTSPSTPVSCLRWFKSHCKHLSLRAAKSRAPNVQLSFVNESECLLLQLHAHQMMTDCSRKKNCICIGQTSVILGVCTAQRRQR